MVSPTLAQRGTPHQDDETPLGFLSAVPVVRCAIPKDGEGSFVPLRGTMPV